MPLVLFDASALIALLVDEPAAAEVERLATKGNCAITSVNLAEVVDHLTRTRRTAEGRVEEALKVFVGTQIKVVMVSENDGWRAGKLRASHYNRRDRALSLGDSVLLAVAANREYAIATSDSVVTSIAADEQLTVVPLPNSAGKLPN